MGDQLGFSARSASTYVTECEATDILGSSAILTQEQSRLFWESGDDAIRVIESIPFSRETLLACAVENKANAQWRLVYLLGLAPLLMLCKVGMTTRLITPHIGSIDGPDVAIVNDPRVPSLCKGGVDFIMKHRNMTWSHAPRPVGWRLINFQPRHRARTWREQSALLTAGSNRLLERAHDRDVIEATLALWGVTGVEHLPEFAHWGFPRATGEPPTMVTINSEGMYVSAVIPDTVEFYSWLGVCAQIAPDHPNLSPTA